MAAHSTTDLKVLRSRHRRNKVPYFTWGLIKRFHDIGDHYTIVEYEPEIGDADSGVLFHPYVAGRDTAHSFDSLESAIVFAIACSKFEVNLACHLSMAAQKLLDLLPGSPPTMVDDRHSRGRTLLVHARHSATLDELGSADFLDMFSSGKDGAHGQ